MAETQSKIFTRFLKNFIIVGWLRAPQRVVTGSYTLSGGTAAVTFPEAFSDVTNLVILLQSDTANAQRPSSPTTSGFTANGTGTDTGKYLAIGNIKF